MGTLDLSWRLNSLAVETAASDAKSAYADDSEPGVEDFELIVREESKLFAAIDPVKPTPLQWDSLAIFAVDGKGCIDRFNGLSIITNR